MQKHAFYLLWAAFWLGSASLVSAQDDRPNILFIIADDWSWPHAGAYGDRVVQTPAFDRIAREGVLFEHAFVSSPSCTPSRASVLTGQWHWRLGAGANLYGPLPAEHPVYPELLEDAGYHAGYVDKGWAPGDLGDRTRNPAGKIYESFEAFLDNRPRDAPFVFWFGSHDPHRIYDTGIGEKSGMVLDEISVPPIFPDSPQIRGDIADYYWEIQRMDNRVAEMLNRLASIGEEDNTIIVYTSDNGMPFPRAKGNLYDMGTRVPLAIRWPDRIAGDQQTDAFISLTDLAPTFLEAAGLPIPEVMTGQSLLALLTENLSGTNRTQTLIGRERHLPAQEAPDGGGYPMRAIRTRGFLYVRNFTPDRWPAGTPNFERAFFHPAWYADIDNGPTKKYMFENRNRDEAHRRLFDLAFGKRPMDELYDLSKDPAQMHNIADDPTFAEQRRILWDQLMAALQRTHDPRVKGQGDLFDLQPYSGGVVRPYWWSK